MTCFEGTWASKPLSYLPENLLLNIQKFFLKILIFSGDMPFQIRCSLIMKKEGKASSEGKGFVTICGRREGSGRDDGPQRVATEVLQPKDGVHCLKTPSDSRMFH